MKASRRPSINPMLLAQVGVLASVGALLVAIGVFEWPPGGGGLRFVLFFASLVGGYALIHFLDKMKVRGQFPLSAEGASLFAAWQPLVRQDWQGALRTYRSVLEKYPENTEALLHAALLEIQFDEMDQAEARLQTLLKTCGDDPEVQHAHAILLHNRGRFAEAAETYARHLEKNDYRAMAGRAFALYQTGDRDRAWEEARKAAQQYVQIRYRRSVDVEFPGLAIGHAVWFLAPNLETAEKETNRIYQWTESFWHGNTWRREFDELEEGKKYRARALLMWNALLGRAEEGELTDHFESREVEPQYVLSGAFTLAVRRARVDSPARALEAWRGFLDWTHRYPSPPLIASRASFEGNLARFEIARLEAAATSAPPSSTTAS